MPDMSKLVATSGDKLLKNLPLDDLHLMHYFYDYYEKSIWNVKFKGRSSKVKDVMTTHQCMHFHYRYNHLYIDIQTNPLYLCIQHWNDMAACHIRWNLPWRIRIEIKSLRKKLLKLITSCVYPFCIFMCIRQLLISLKKNDSF